MGMVDLTVRISKIALVGRPAHDAAGPKGVLTHPTLVEGLTSLFSSAASAHNVVETRGAQISAA
jgi:hypothetical protein